MAWAFAVLGTVAYINSDYVGIVAAVMGFAAACFGISIIHNMLKKLRWQDTMLESQARALKAMRQARQP
jgi:hypothetical protein